MDPATLGFLGTLALIAERTVDKFLAARKSDKSQAKKLAAAAKKEAIKQMNLELARRIEAKAKAMEKQLELDIAKLKKSRLQELEQLRADAVAAGKQDAGR